MVYDALQAARSRQADIVIIDTAGRLHTKYNLMEELKKMHRVAAKVDATTGQNGLAQAQHFSEAVGVTSIILSKLDGTAKGGIVLAICDEMKLPIRLIGTGEGLEDLVPFEPDAFVEALCA